MRKSRVSDIQLPRPSYLPEPTTVLFSYELGEDNLRMLHALQHREGLPSLKAAFIECLGIATTLVEKTEAGYEIVSRKNEIIEPLEIDSYFRDLASTLLTKGILAKRSKYLWIKSWKCDRG